MNVMIYLDLECLLLDSCSNSPNQSHTKNDAYHKTCGYSTAVLRNHSKEINTAFPRGEDCLSTIFFNTKKLHKTPLTHKQQKEHDKADKYHIRKRRFIYEENISSTKTYLKLRIMIITKANTEVRPSLSAI